MINRSHIFEQTINSEWYVSHTLPLLESIMEENIHHYFMQDGARTHTAGYSITLLSKVFENRLINHSYGLQGLQT
jgi:hypothetical protein